MRMQATSKIPVSAYFGCGLMLALLGALAYLNAADRLLAVGISVFLGSLLLLSSAVVYEAMFAASIASLHWNPPGPDPIIFLLPILIITGALFAHLRLRRLAVPSSVWAYVVLFFTSFVLADIFGTPNLTLVGAFLANTALMIIIILRVNTTTRMRHLWMAIIVGGVLGAIGGIAAALGFWADKRILFETLSGGRFQALMGDPNMLALNTMVIMIWLLDEILEPKLWKGSTRLKSILLFLATTELIATLSRAAWVATIFCFAAYLGARYSVAKFLEIRLRSVGVTIAALVLIFALGFGVLKAVGLDEVLIRRLDSPSEASENPMEAKRASFGFTRQVLGVALSHPFGVGTGRAEQLFFAGEGGRKQNVGAHNTYVEVMADDGWLALIGYLGVLWVAIKHISTKARRNETRYGVSFSMIFAALIGLGTFSAFHDVLFWPFSWLVPAIAFSMLWGQQGDSEPEARVA